MAWKKELIEMIRPLFTNIEFWIFAAMGGLYQVSSAKRSGIKIDWVYMVAVFSSCSMLGFVILKAVIYYDFDLFYGYLAGSIVFTASNNILVQSQESVKGLVIKIFQFIPSLFNKK